MNQVESSAPLSASDEPQSAADLDVHDDLRAFWRALCEWTRPAGRDRFPVSRREPDEPWN